jgi:hypothetical protein
MEEPHPEPETHVEERKEVPVEEVTQSTTASLNNSQSSNFSQQIDKRSFDKAYEDAIFSRKQESFTHFQAWENKRKLIVTNHKNITNNMINRIEKKLEWIDSGVEVIVKFFKERISQEEHYVKIMTQALPQLGKSFHHATQPELFAHFAKAMQESDDFHKRQSTNSQVMAKYIHSDILDDLILASEKEYKKKLDKLREPVADSKKKLQGLSQTSAKKIASYIKLFEETQKKGKQPSKEKDMYKKEVEHVVAAQEEMKCVKNFGLHALEYLNELIKLLTIRLNNVQKAMTLYYQKCTDFYGASSANPELALKAVEGLKTGEDVQNYFLITNTFAVEEVKYFREACSNKSDITYADIYNVLVEKSVLAPLEHKPLVVKEWRASKEAGLLKGWKPCAVVVSADSSVLIIEKTPEGEFAQVDTVLKLQQLKIQKNEARKDRSILEIMEINPGILLDSKIKVTLKFESDDGAEEFLHYVYNYYNSSIINEVSKK